MILDLPLLLETRRNHAVEHATLHILARKYTRQNMAGHSNPTGFYLMGNFTKEDIQEAAAEAMQRARSNFWRVFLIPFSIALAVFGYFLSKPLGPWLQRNVTTEANLGNMRIVDIIPVRKGLHRVITK